MKAFGVNEVRGAIIRYLAKNPTGDTSGTIARDLHLTYHTVFRHLQELKALGIVIDDGGDHRAGQRLIYQLDRQALRNALDDFGAYVEGE